MSFIEYSQYNKRVLDDFLNKEITSWQEEVVVEFPNLSKIFDIFIDGFEGGKKLRAILVRLGYEIITDKEDECTLLPAIAYEIFQTAILAHDDIIDESPLRRGKPTMFKSLEKLGSKIHFSGKDYLHY
jgi:geranylgeranyl pyrophosphate synthase